MEYSVRSAQMAVYKLLPDLGKEPTPFQHVSRNIHIVYNAFKAMNTWAMKNRDGGGVKPQHSKSGAAGGRGRRSPAGRGTVYDSGKTQPP